MIARLIFICLLNAVLLLPAHASTLTVAAASDLRFALTDIAADYERAHPGTLINLVFASSGKLFSQLSQGAPYDLFLSADIDYPQRLYDAGLAAHAPVAYAQGRLLLWSTRHDIRNLALADLTQARFQRIAVAQPLHAPYGRLARDVLTQHGLWHTLQSRLVFADNIAHAAQLVASGAADVGLLAHSVVPHVEGYPRTIDHANASPLVQGYVITARTPDTVHAANQFADWLRGPSAQAVLVRYGFAVQDATP